MIVASNDRKVYEEQYGSLLGGTVRAMSIDNTDDATLYWLAYTSALFLHYAQKETISEAKEIQL